MDPVVVTVVAKVGSDWPIASGRDRMNIMEVVEQAAQTQIQAIAVRILQQAVWVEEAAVQGATDALEPLG